MSHYSVHQYCNITIARHIETQLDINIRISAVIFKALNTNQCFPPKNLIESEQHVLLQCKMFCYVKLNIQKTIVQTEYFFNISRTNNKKLNFDYLQNTHFT